MGVPTHVMEYSGDSAVSMGAGAGPLQFQGPLGAFGEDGNWSLVLYALPPGKDYTDVANEATTEYLQAAGHSASAITIEIRKPGGAEWGAQWVRYVIGHRHDPDAPLDVTIELPPGPLFISRAEVFDSQEAAEIFISYYKTGEIPEGYALRPVEGYTADGRLIDLRGVSA
ncbi:Uncharacterised protein [Mycobacteroides abscessus subsp. bolletii]|uniref:Uncharacterized protein n=1 Tax=Mycobacteroides abscessus subsp. bolletii TaxID=319705 RepID=A0A9Q7WJD8_9MYCO|nr:hypothetical protein [Mycobacteroides abscessus]SHT86893.1 Uncharacterised protein [Mycobacteroides abscessus subsp. bolletii]SHU01447.1 Uncharacterised protein [Mycobacteroides abscessus subsp. bolletii]SHX43693.1 Uncharacterised protein [Mycobacteroides abscessus subsp. bolletii]SKM63411.1 Uncharacterised protein [Mycobacteroides abscessus subsp. bolletii]SKN38285.1 Uncharacterised protein [Mycobacteroides abscessus subsp. bolletii]